MDDAPSPPGAAWGLSSRKRAALRRLSGLPAPDPPPPLPAAPGRTPALAPMPSRWPLRNGQWTPAHADRVRLAWVRLLRGSFVLAAAPHAYLAALWDSGWSGELAREFFDLTPPGPPPLVPPNPLRRKREPERFPRPHGAPPA